MDMKHIGEEMERFIASIENEHGISRSEIARNGVYFSHETSTHASPTASCAWNEISGTKQFFYYYCFYFIDTTILIVFLF